MKGVGDRGYAWAQQYGLTLTKADSVPAAVKYPATTDTELATWQYS